MPGINPMSCIETVEENATLVAVESLLVEPVEKKSAVSGPSCTQASSWQPKSPVSVSGVSQRMTCAVGMSDPRKNFSSDLRVILSQCFRQKCPSSSRQYSISLWACLYEISLPQQLVSVSIMLDIFGAGKTVTVQL